MASNGIFITGTDTGCGKTEITLALMKCLQSEGRQVLGFKPVAAGAEESGEGLRNEDALRIQNAGSMALPYELINPYVFEPPVAPHIAAAEAGRVVDAEVIRNCFEALSELADVVIVEGAGGWRVPLASDMEMSDLPNLLNIPVLLVVGLRLGCLNHALLSADGITEKGSGLAGWVANQLDSEQPRQEENLYTLDQLIPAPRIARFGHFSEGADTGIMAEGFDVATLNALLDG